MRLYYYTLVLLLFVVLTYEVTVMKKAIDQLEVSVALMYAKPIEPFKPKRFKPQPLEDCPWILSEPVPENPTPPDIL